MSRNITESSKTRLSQEERTLMDTHNGKLLFTTYEQKYCAFLIENERLKAAQFFQDIYENRHEKIGAVYVGKVKNVVKNIDACFVEIAEKELCFLPMKNVQTPFLLNRVYNGRILEGDELLVQVERDAQKTKQASVTAQISLSNDYFALNIGSKKVYFSGKLNKKTKETILQILADHKIASQENLIQNFKNLLSPTDYQKMQEEGMLFSLPPIGIIVRTKAEECQETEELLRHFYDLSAEFIRLLSLSRHRSCFSCLKKAPKNFERVFDKMVYPFEFQEIVTDDKAFYKELKEYCNHKFPEKKVRFYQDSDFSLCKLYGLKTKLDTALNNHVWLKSGGYLVIESTEALTVIDVNSGKYEGKKDVKEAFFKVNQEAAKEIALQLRLRNLSGIIIVDFINMIEKEKQQEILELLRKYVKNDKMKTTVVDMTPLGLVEITRKKENKSLKEQISF